MGTEDKAAHKAEEARGKVKRKVGEAVDSPGLRAEGAAEETLSKAKQLADDAAQKAREAAEEAKENARQAVDRNR